MILFKKEQRELVLVWWKIYIYLSIIFNNVRYLFIVSVVCESLQYEHELWYFLHYIKELYLGVH